MSQKIVPFLITYQMEALFPTIFRLNEPWGCEILGSPCGFSERSALTACDAVLMGHVLLRLEGILVLLFLSVKRYRRTLLKDLTEETCRRTLQKKLTEGPYRRNLQKDLTEEPYGGTLQKKLTEGPYRRTLPKYLTEGPYRRTLHCRTL
jgi:hypothetical protein